MNGRALSVKEVAFKLGIRQHSILALIRSGELRAFDISLMPGGRPRWRILEEDLEAFILRRTHQAAPPRRRKLKQRRNVKKFF